MSSLQRFLALALAAALFTACSSTRFVSTWKEPTAGPGELAGQKIAAFVMSSEQGSRRAAEDTLASELRARGADGIAGYTLLPGDTAKDRDAAKRKLEQAGVGVVVVMRPAGQEQELRSTPGTWHTVPRYRSWSGYWGYGWGAVYEPGEIRTDTIVSVETVVYSVASDKLIWAGRSKTTNPSDVGSFVEELAAAVDDEMRQSGLLR